MRDELFEILTALLDDTDVRVVVFRGAGAKAFCAGADLSEFLTAPSPTKARLIRFQRDIWGMIARLSQPVIAALHGYVFGSGLELALLCDMRIATPTTVFGLPETGLGIIPAAGGTQTTPRAAGCSRALELLMTGRRLTAQEAFEMGFINRVIPETEIEPSIESLTNRVSSLNPVAVQMVKKVMKKGLERPLSQGLHLEQRAAELLQGIRKKGG